MESLVNTVLLKQVFKKVLDLKPQLRNRGPHAFLLAEEKDNFIHGFYNL